MPRKTSLIYTNTQYNEYVSTHSYSNTQYKDAAITIEEGEFGFSRTYANSEMYPNIPNTTYNTTDWYLGYLTGTSSGSWSFNYAQLGESVDVKVPNTLNTGSVSYTYRWYKGPFSGGGRAKTGNSPSGYSFNYIARKPG